MSNDTTVGLWSGSSWVAYAALRLAMAVALAADVSSAGFSDSSSNPGGTCGDGG